MESKRQARKPLDDATNRVNQTPARTEAKKPVRWDKASLEQYLDVVGLKGSARKRVFNYYTGNMPPAPRTSTTGPTLESAGTQPANTTKASTTSNAKAAKAATGASSSRKRKAETSLSLEDEIAAYKRNLDDIVDPDSFDDEIMPNCTTVRGRINKLFDGGIMTKAEFCRATGCNSNSLSNFLKAKGPMGGCNSSVYANGWRWLRQREAAGLKMPDVKKRQLQEAKAAGAGASGSKSSITTAASLPDISGIHLNGEEADSVSVYDTCDEIRKKINAHLKTPGLTQAQFCRDLYAQLNAPTIKSIQSKQLADFRAGKGSRTGAKSTVFYTAYVYFEKLRIAQGKPKSKHRETMEEIWMSRGGFDRDMDHRTYCITSSDKGMYWDQYGLSITYPL